MRPTAGVSMNRIELSNLSCIRGGLTLFAGLSTQIESGQVMRLIGPNGCGKSSLLKTIAGRIPPSQGRVTYGSRPLQAKDFLYLDHKPLMKPMLSVAENLSFWAELYNASSHQSKLAYEALGLDSLAYLPTKVLSAGQKKRLQLALLFLKRAPVWLLDEPLLSLDHTHMSRLGEIIQQHQKNEGLLIYASHDPISGIDECTLSLMEIDSYPRGSHDLSYAA
jgi:heme exporter protein A